MPCTRRPSVVLSLALTLSAGSAGCGDDTDDTRAALASPDAGTPSGDASAAQPDGALPARPVADAGGTGRSDASTSDAGDAAPAQGSAGCAKQQTPGTSLRTVNVAGTTRTYAVSIPAGKTGPQPLYMVFHGAGGNHDSVSGLGFDAHGIAVYPDGQQQGGGGTGWDESPTSNDVAMFDAIVSALSADLCVDTARIYTAGFSWGGWIASALGCLRGDAVAGFASVEGGFLNDTKSCRGAVPAFIIHDKRDPAEPFPAGERLRDAFLSVNSAKDPSPYDAPNPCVRYTGSAPVVFCSPDEGAHTWQSFATQSITSFFAAQ